MLRLSEKVRSPLFKRATDSFHLELLNDQDFQSSVDQIISQTHQKLEFAQEFVLILTEIDRDSFDNDKAAFLEDSLEALKLSIRDQESILILISEDHRTLKNALGRLRKLQEVEDTTIESPPMRLKTEKPLSLKEALNRFQEHQRSEEDVNQSSSIKPGF